MISHSMHTVQRTKKVDEGFIYQPDAFGVDELQNLSFLDDVFHLNAG
jgi:hypothetical protein